MKTYKSTIRIIIVLLLVFLVSLNTSTTYAYWNSFNSPNTIKTSYIGIGSWVVLPWEEDYNLNVWVEEDTLDQVIPDDVIFVYNGLLYTTREGQQYNPEYHGLPGGPDAPRWAIIALELEWIPYSNYRVNSVVTRNGKYYIANIQYNANDWFVNDPAETENNPWSEWREIEPISEDIFGYIEGTNLKDYRIDPSLVVYK